MLSNSIRRFKSFYFWILLFYGFIMAGAPACKNEEKTDEIKSCLTLTKEQLNNWIPGYSKPGNAADNMISAVSFHPTYNTNTKTYGVVARAFNSKGTQLGNDLALNTDQNCEIGKLEERIYQFSFTDLQIVESGTGDFISKFERLILEPKAETIGSADVLKFDLAAVIDGAIVLKSPILP